MKTFCSAFILLVAIKTATMAQTSIPFSVEQTGQYSWRIKVSNSAPHIALYDADSVASLVQMAGHVPFTEAGAVTLPIKRFWLPVPHNGILRAKVVSYQDDSQQITLRPAPVDLYTQQQPPRTVPGSRDYLNIGSRQRIDGIEKQSLDLVSARYNSSSNTLRWLTSMVIEISVDNHISNAAPIADLDIVDQQIAAYNRDTDAILSWFGPGAEMLRITTPDEGVYRITYLDAQAAALPVTNIDPATFKLFLDGKEKAIMVYNAVPGQFLLGDYIEFYAPRRSGINGEYFNEWSDDNVFWLAWGGEPGLRSGSENASPATEPGLQTVPTHRHFEEDRTYHIGDSDEFDGTFTDKRPGEAWVWYFILRDSSYSATFDLPDVVDEPAYIVSKLKKSSSHGSRIRLTINGNTIKEFDVDNWYHGAPLPLEDTAIVSASLLKKGINTIIYTSIGKNPPGDNVIERVYLDCFDVYYQADGSSQNGVRKLQNEAYGLGDPVPARFHSTLSGFGSPRIRVFNTRTGDTLRDFPVNQDGTSWQTTIATDAVNSYFVYDESAVQSPASMTKITMTGYGTENNTAEYIVVTHKNFMQASQRIANYRSSADGYQTMVVDVDDLYNEFNYGHKDPVAIKRLMMKAYGTWQEPKPSFLTLMGDASWDPKHLHPTAVKNDYVPAFGNPVSDTYYITVDSANVYPLVNVGRIPCETNAAAEAVIDKIISYEAMPPADWHNRFLITSGGINTAEFATFVNINESYIANYFVPNCLEYHRIYKKDPSLVGYEDLDSIITHVNQGILWLNFVGHGGSRIIDIGIERPEIFDVQGKYHLFNTLSCNTAHFAEPHETGLNEKFALAPQNAAIGTIGTSGLGYLTRDVILGNSMFEAVMSGQVRTFGEVLTHGKIGLLTASDPKSDWIARNTALQVMYMGDPATKIPLEKLPELAIGEDNVASEPEILVQGSQALFTIEFQNHGFCMNDSVTARFALSSDGQVFYTAERRIPPFAEAISTEWPVSLGSISGSITISIEIDTDTVLVERTKVNNTLRIERNVLRRGVTPVFPHNSTVVDAGTSPTTFVFANPSIVPIEADDVTIELQVSSKDDFSSTIVERSIEIENVFTWFEDITGISTNGTKYWRGRMVVDGVPEEWSPTSSFAVRSSITDEYFEQTERSQIGTAIRQDVDLLQNGSLVLGERNAKVTVFSAANNQNNIFNLAQLIIDGTDFAPNSRGFNAAVIDPITGKVVERALFDTYSGSAEVNRMISFIRNIPDNYYLALAVHDDANGWHRNEGHTNLIPELQDELKQYGCTLFEQGYPDVWWHISYAMFGRRSDPSATKQQVNSFGAAFVNDTISVHVVQGKARSTLAGPANSWNDFRWMGSLPTPDSHVDLTIYSGLASADSVLMMKQSIQPNEPVSLSTLGATNPYVFFELTLRDTTTLASPVVTGWSANFVSEYPELGITNQVVESDPDSVLEGKPITMTIQVYNAGRKPALNVPVYIRTPLSQSQGLTPIVIPEIEAGKDEYEEIEYDIQTAGLRGNWNTDIEVASELSYPEYYKGNNIYSERFASSKDTERPDLVVLFDKLPIVDLDFVSPTPVIDISLFDNSPLPVTDTSSMQLFLDGRRVWLDANPDLTYTLGSTAEEKFVIRYTPQLRTGIRTLSITGKDADGNAVDSIPYQVRFQVKEENLVDQMYPVPNPSDGPMHFTFRLIGTEPPESGSVKVYTIAGRLIREIEIHESEMRIGFNRIAWDGRDQDGDLLANGVYLYKLSLKRSESNQEFLGKVAILR